MRNIYIAFIFACLFLTSCAHQQQDELGYLDPPKELVGLWENQKSADKFLKFLSNYEYQTIYNETGVSIDYNYFKVFHITNDGLIYAIVRHVWNKYHRDGDYILTQSDLVKEMTNEEINKANADYFYVLFDLDKKEYHPYYNMADGCFNFFKKICNSSLEQQHITLSRKDFELPATIHWQRVQPKGTCHYSGYWHAVRPEFDEQDSYCGPWEKYNDLLPWSAIAKLKAENVKNEAQK